jgi:DNA invertase Pin-like site-specific DNA recombinase
MIYYWYNQTKIEMGSAMKVGYARVSTIDQSLDLQKDALRQAGCDRIFVDEGVSGAKTERKGLTEALDYLRKGDTLVVWKLDRLGRSLADLVQKVEFLKQQGIHFCSLTENVDTSTSTGPLIFAIFCGLAETERNLIRERTRAGLVAARARGRKGGRPPALTTENIAMAKTLYEGRQHSIPQICRLLGVSKNTLYKALRTAD